MSDATSITQFLNNDQVVASVKAVLKERTPQFIASIVSLTSASESLRNCDRKSLLSACMTAAALNLPINSNLGFAYIIPYKDKAQFQMGYKGFIQLAIRSGQYTKINAVEVREGEIKKNDLLTGDIKFKFIESVEREKTPIIGYVAYFKLKNGFSKMLYMTKEELKNHGLKYSQNFKKNNTGLWKDDFDGMSLKTVLKLLLSKFGVLDTDLAKALESDQAVMDDGSLGYPDNEKETPEAVAAEKERARIITHIKDAKTIQDLEAVEEYIPDDEVKKMYDERHNELFKTDGAQEEGK